MKSPLRISLLVLGILVFLVVGSAWLSWRFALLRLHSPQSVVEETGLRLPGHARIIATQARLFSLVDGSNYEWLVQSDTSLLPWAATNMQIESGGWEHVRQMAELGFPDEMPRGARFGKVWRSHRYTSPRPDETSYLYLSDDGKVGILETFRP